MEFRESKSEWEDGADDGTSEGAAAAEPAIDPPRDEVPPESAEPVGRRYPSTIGGAIYLLVLAASAVGLVIVAQGHWRPGVKWVSVALGLAAVARVVVPAPQAGMLAVRRRLVDVLILAIAAGALWFLSSSIPNQPPL